MQKNKDRDFMYIISF